MKSKHLKGEEMRKTSHFVFPAVDLKEGDGSFAVDLVARRMS